MARRERGLEHYRIPPVFERIKRAADAPDADMLRTFNLGVGLTVVCRHAIPRRCSRTSRRRRGSVAIGEILAGPARSRFAGVCRSRGADPISARHPVVREEPPLMNSLLLYAGQIDIGFMLLRGLEKLGLVWEIQVPQNLPLLRRHIAGYPGCRARSRLESWNGFRGLSARCRSRGGGRRRRRAHRYRIAARVFRRRRRRLVADGYGIRAARADRGRSSHRFRCGAHPPAHAGLSDHGFDARDGAVRARNVCDPNRRSDLRSDHPAAIRRARRRGRRADGPRMPFHELAEANPVHGRIAAAPARRSRPW